MAYVNEIVLADLAQIKQTKLGLERIAEAAPGLTFKDEQKPMSFSRVLFDNVRAVDGQQREADNQAEEVASGKSNDLVGAMLSNREASLSFAMLLQARNKIVGAVDDLIKMPV